MKAFLSPLRSFKIDYQITFDKSYLFQEPHIKFLFFSKEFEEVCSACMLREAFQHHSYCFRGS